MFRNLFLAAILAALCAGLATSVIQHTRLTPMILVAETYEGEDDHDHAAEEAGQAVAAHSHDEDEWAPEDGLERTAYTVFANLLAAAGYALIIGAVSVFLNLPITWSTGLLWGLGGFAAFSLAPAFGLAPGLPGMPVADTLARQIWWAGTAISTGAGLLLVAKYRAAWALAAAVVLIAVPHVIGAPVAPYEHTDVPASLAAAFSAAVIFNGAVFWVVLGLAFGRFADYFARRPA